MSDSCDTAHFHGLPVRALNVGASGDLTGALPASALSFASKTAAPKKAGVTKPWKRDGKKMQIADTPASPTSTALRDYALNTSRL